MEAWTIIMLSIPLLYLIIKIITLRVVHVKSPSLPPGPMHIPLITNIICLTTYSSFSKLRPLLPRLHAKHGPIITLPIWSGPHIFIADASLAHQALLQNAAVFANRPYKTLSTIHRQLNITSSPYGPTWRLLRRNLTSYILQPSFSSLRKSVLRDLLTRLKLSITASSSSSSSSIRVDDHVHDAVLSMLVFMCFGDEIQENKIHHMKRIQRALISGFNRFSVLNFLPRVVYRVVFPQRCKEYLHLREQQKLAFKEVMEERRLSRKNKDDKTFVFYVDTLLELVLPAENNRKLEEDEVISLCSEFLSAGTDTTSTALEWIVANLVKYPLIQTRLADEIAEVVRERGGNDDEVEEEDLEKLPYLKAVILEGLRRHPPSHFLLPHAVTEDTVLNGYLIPKKATVNFTVAEMGWDPKVWEDPMGFKPERFLNAEEFGASGKKEINNKMMPFGAGRRMCPAYGLAMLHLEYLVANLVLAFKWSTVHGGDALDLSEKQGFTTAMKHPLHARISPRF
ncbi:hypothetical protein PIB30_049093 [Stylosanthes scabra]|uniref:Cytochrome P450 n=1 Tax=Stylosanthes scabra TaxID=79078 RepID=A0ABU6RH87_9FABA|nr:hypothetical protein [Stylosanthes scabra]